MIGLVESIGCRGRISKVGIPHHPFQPTESVMMYAITELDARDVWHVQVCCDREMYSLRIIVTLILSDLRSPCSEDNDGGY